MSTRLNRLIASNGILKSKSLAHANLPEFGSPGLAFGLLLGAPSKARTKIA